MKPSTIFAVLSAVAPVVLALPVSPGDDGRAQDPSLNAPKEKRSDWDDFWDYSPDLSDESLAIMRAINGALTHPTDLEIDSTGA